MATKDTSFSESEVGKPDLIVRSVPFFYGWIMLAIAVIAQVMTSPGQSFGVSVFTEYFKSALSMSASQVSGAYLLGTLLASLPMAYFGFMLDRYGLRKMLGCVAILFGLACAFTSQVKGGVSLFFAFLFLRMFGQGCLAIVAANTVAMWFSERLGRVAGLMGVLGNSGSVMFAPGLFLWLIHSVGWRQTYLVLGLSVWAVLLPIAAVLYRNRPEDVGLSPDGLNRSAEDQEENSNEIQDTWSDDRNYSLRQAARTRAFWILVANMVAFSMIATGLTFQITSLFGSHGLDEKVVALTFTIFGLSMAGIQLIGGYLVDRAPLNALLATSIGIFSIAIAVLVHAHTPAAAYAYGALFGCSHGLFVVLSSTIWVKYYGRKHLGKIRATTFTAGVAGSSLGPFVMGYTFDQFGSYDPSLWFFLVILVPLAVSGLFATRPVIAPAHS